MFVDIEPLKEHIEKYGHVNHMTIMWNHQWRFHRFYNFHYIKSEILSSIYYAMCSNYPDMKWEK